MSWKSLGFKSYKEYLESYLWQEKRLFILKQFPICYKCKKKEATEVHHLNYKRVGNEGVRDIVTLCRNCHKTEHGK